MQVRNRVPILVTGGRGKTGSEVVRQLTERGAAVRSGSTSPGESSEGVTPVLFDWQNPGTWAAAVEGVESAYIMRPDLEEAPAMIADLVELMPHASIVLLSEQGTGSLPETSWERRVEAAVTERAGSWTVLRPTWFHQVLTDPRYYLGAVRDDDVLPIPSGGRPIAFVDTRDIAAVAVAALLDGAGAGESITVTGPDALTIEQAADLLSAAIGRAITAVEPSKDEAVAGLDPWLATIYAGVLDRVSEGGYADITDDVSRITGRKARPLADFVSEHVDFWQSATRVVI